MLTTHKNKPVKIIHLYILKDNRKNNALQISNQVYIIKDNEGLSKKIYDLLDEFALLDKVI